MRLLRLAIIAAAILTIPLTSYGWTKTYGGEDDDEGFCIEETADGGYIIVGRRAYYLWLLKTDVNGDTLWTHTYPGPSKGRCVQQTKDGGFIIVGLIDPYGDQESVVCSDSLGPYLWVVKTDSLGDTLWTRWDLLGVGHFVQQTSDGGYIITGESNGDLLLAKTDSLGDTTWTRTYGAEGLDCGYCVHETADGGYIVSGHLASLPSLWLLKTDEAGDTLWTRSSLYLWGWGKGYCVQQTSDGGYIVTGYMAATEDGKYHLILSKTDSSGDTLWTHIDWEWLYPWDSSGSVGCCVQQTSDGGYIVAGYTQPSYWEEIDDLWLIKTDSLGDTLWTRIYVGEEPDWGRCVCETADSCYVVAGATTSFGAGGSDLWLLKTNLNGDTLWYEVSAVTIEMPKEDSVIDYMTPTAWFKNCSSHSAEDFYCHCEIWLWSGDSAACAYLSPPYHVKYWVSYSVEPGDSILIKFSEWMCDDSAQYTARFYTSKEKEPIWQTREKSVTFYGEPWSGVVEDQPINLPPHWEIVTSCGREIILQYSGYPQGFQASVFDVAGRQVDELETSSSSGLITWGEGCVVGVYFIRASGSQAKEVKRFIIMR